MAMSLRQAEQRIVDLERELGEFATNMGKAVQAAINNAVQAATQPLEARIAQLEQDKTHLEHQLQELENRQSSGQPHQEGLGDGFRRSLRR